MDAFIWDQRYLTGEPIVDHEHQELVRMINLVIDPGEQPLSKAQVPVILNQLVKYAAVHFKHEEQLMRDSGLDPRSIEQHSKVHQEFATQVTQMLAMDDPNNDLEYLLNFLTAWLAQHILGMDQAMARQIRAIRAGQTASVAYETERHATQDPSTTSMLEAMAALYRIISARNEALNALNRSLESQVKTRTQDLERANHQLEQEQQELTQLLSKVEEAQQQLLQSEKMAAIGQLAAGIAHEINNPIGFVNSNLGSLKTYTAHLLQLIDAFESGQAAAIAEARQKADLEFLREDLPSLLAESQDGLNRVTRIVQDLKDFSRVDQAERQHADLNAALSSTLNVVRNELKYKADLLIELGAIPEIECYPAQLNQVFMNLLVNAAQAIAGRGKITVRTGVDRDNVFIEIEDTGCGMSEETRHHIFEPFFTTKPVGHGTGLGLSISYDIVVKKHHGSLDVKSEPGKGSCFRITLPIHPPTPSAE